MLHIEDLYKSYGANRVLDNIDLTVSQGEFCTLVGPSGCGKSTLLKLILGSQMPTEGRVEINGKQVGFPDKNRGIVFQKYSLYDHLTVLQNVLMFRNLSEKRWFLPWGNTPSHVDEAMFYLKKLRVDDAANKYPDELSGGMRQRVAIAQALVAKPPVLLMDEPFGALDANTREDIQLFLLELWKEESLTIFFVTHDLEEACFVGSRLLVLSQYYSDDRGSSASRGAKIVTDISLPPVGMSTEIKTDPEFQKIIARVKREGIDPEILQHVTEFNLTHPDSFQSLQAEENSEDVFINEVT